MGNHQSRSECQSRMMSLTDSIGSNKKKRGGEMPIGESVSIMPERPGLKLDQRLLYKYDIMAVVGKGSFSQVLRVQHKITGVYYAVKIVTPDRELGQAVNNEIAILGRVSHPFVIRLEEVFRNGPKCLIVMELAIGGEMYDRIVAKGRYSENEARQALRMLLSGLAYLHSLSIFHRDLKPENLLYSDGRPDARLLITDFGLAHQSLSLGGTATDCTGTPEYIAPEVLLRIPYTEKVDMWSCGVIAYVLMSGILPFDDDCRSRLYTHIITANYVYYPQYWSGSELAKQFVDSLLITDPNERLSSIQALRHDWITGESKTHFTISIKARPESNSMQRTKSTRSIRSVTRSDHGHRVDPREVDQLANDLQKLAKNQLYNSQKDNYHSSKHYGVF